MKLEYNKIIPYIEFRIQGRKAFSLALKVNKLSGPCNSQHNCKLQVHQQHHRYAYNNCKLPVQKRTDLFHGGKLNLRLQLRQYMQL